LINIGSIGISGFKCKF